MAHIQLRRRLHLSSSVRTLPSRSLLLIIAATLRAQGILNNGSSSRIGVNESLTAALSN